MNDARLREQEAGWGGSGSVEDEAAWLLERVRVGELTKDHLQLLVRLGHEGACAAQETAPTPWTQWTVSEEIQTIRDFAPQMEELVQETLERLRDAHEASHAERLANLVWPDRTSLCTAGLSSNQRMRRRIAKRIHDPRAPDLVQEGVDEAQRALCERLATLLLHGPEAPE